MNNQTMVKVAVSKDALSLKMVSPDFKSPHRFIILKSEMRELEERKHLIVADIHSFIKMRKLHTVDGEEFIQMTCSWLWRSNDNILSGREESIRLPYGLFQESAFDAGAMEGREWKLLSIPVPNWPKIEFQSRHNLKKVIENPMLRSKLGRFLDKSFNWVDYRSIIVTDDFLPYSFTFRGYTQYGGGVCGGIILTKQEDLRKSYYSLHT